MGTKLLRIDDLDDDLAELVLEAATFAEFREVLARLSESRAPTIFAPGSQEALYFHVEPAQPEHGKADFPGEARIRVRAVEPPPHSVRWLFVLASNESQDSMIARVVSLTFDGDDQAVLELRLETPEDYNRVRGFVDLENGCAMKTDGGAVHYVRRERDDHSPGTPFPQNVEMLLRVIPADDRRPARG